MAKHPTGYREMLGSYPGLQLMILFDKSLVLVPTGTVDDPSNFSKCFVMWTGKRKVHSSIKSFFDS